MPTRAETLARLLKETRTKLAVLHAKDGAAMVKFNSTEDAMRRQTDAVTYETQHLHGEKEAISRLHDEGGISTSERDELLREHAGKVKSLQDGHNDIMGKLDADRRGLLAVINTELRTSIRTAIGHEQFLARRMTAAGLDPSTVQADPAPEMGIEASSPTEASPQADPAADQPPAQGTAAEAPPAAA